MVVFRSKQHTTLQTLPAHHARQLIACNNLLTVSTTISRTALQLQSHWLFRPQTPDAP